MIERMHPAYFETHFCCSSELTRWPKSFAIITAYATTGEFWTKEENETADQELKYFLREHQYLLGRITGYSPTSGHAEPGWAAAMSWEQACDLGQRFQQDAVYYIIDNDLHVTFCDHRRELVRVAAFRDRILWDVKPPFGEINQEAMRQP